MQQSSRCMVCRRLLTDEKSIMHAIGQRCAERMAERAQSRVRDVASGDVYDIPFDAKSLDIFCLCDEAGVRHFNIAQRVTEGNLGGGMAWGVKLAGKKLDPRCFNFAVEILTLFTSNAEHPGHEIRPSMRFAWKHAPEFCERFIVPMSILGECIPGEIIVNWIRERMPTAQRMVQEQIIDHVPVPDYGRLVYFTVPEPVAHEAPPDEGVHEYHYQGSLF